MGGVGERRCVREEERTAQRLEVDCTDSTSSIEPSSQPSADEARRRRNDDEDDVSAPEGGTQLRRQVRRTRKAAHGRVTDHWSRERSEEEGVRRG